MDSWSETSSLAEGKFITRANESLLTLARIMCKRRLRIVIENFTDKMTEAVFNGLSNKHSRAFPKALWSVARRKLDMLNAASIVEDLRVPPGNRLEALGGDLAGFWSIRINEKYRIVFKFGGGAATDVKITDYH